MVEHGAIPYADPFCDGFGWDEEGVLTWPGKGEETDVTGKERRAALPDSYVSGLSARPRGPVEPPKENPSVNPFYPPGGKAGGQISEFGQRPEVFRFEDIPSQ